MTKKVAFTFAINYWTQIGETVAILGDLSLFGSWNPQNAKKMQYAGDGKWQLEIHFDVTPHQVLNYKYIVNRSDGSFIFEQGDNRLLNIRDLKQYPSVLIEDAWKSPSGTEDVAPHLKSAIFKDVVFRREPKSAPSLVPSHKPDENSVLVQFKLYNIFVPPSQTVKVCGSIPELGNWTTAKAPSMRDSSFPVWELEIIVPKDKIPFSYKFVICDEHGDSAWWEDGDNRGFHYTQASLASVEGGRFDRHFQWKGAGVAVPVFSLRTKNGLGVGEFLDIKILADWAVKSGLKVIQILPVNDTMARGDWRDSYPYSSISVFALHPIYIHLPTLTKDATLLKEIESKQKELNNLPAVDYEAVLNFKMKTLRTIYDQTKQQVLSTSQFKEWLSKNEHWLPSYALFCLYRDQYKTTDFAKWNQEHRKISFDDVPAHIAKNKDNVEFYYFVQYNLHLQLKEASDYAARHHVGIKGDIAIGVNPKSVDAWILPHLFNLNMSTGAPPDVFSADGQNWGFPTYNWTAMAKDDFGWWRQRLVHMAQYFHAFRIDHILGFFRIWEIPVQHITGLLGHFSPALPVWRSELEGLGFWDFERLTEPYIRTHLIERYLGNDAEPTKYFVSTGNYSWKLKPEYDSEKKIAAAFPILPSSSLTKEAAAKNELIRQGLYKFCQNVLFLKDPLDSNKLHPRIELMSTTSYAELEPWQRDALKRVYIDYFYRRQDGLWTSVALQRLPMVINSTNMLVCGEDLGMVPDCVQPVMNHLSILGLRIQRMPSDPKQEFMHPSDYGYLTVCTPAVHDTSTLRGWWEEDRGVTQRFWNHCLGEHGAAPWFCDEHVTMKVINQHIYSHAMWSIFAIQDLFGLSRKYYENMDPKDERINVPSIPEHYWRYRIQVNLEDLLSDQDFSSKLYHMMRNAGRLYC